MPGFSSGSEFWLAGMSSSNGIGPDGVAGAEDVEWRPTPVDGAAVVAAVSLP